MIASYNDLVAAIGRWLHRADLASVAPDFITLAEARIYQGSQDAQLQTDPLRLVSMETQVTGTISTNAIAVPDDLIEIRRLVAGSGENARALDYATRGRLTDLQRHSNQPSAYTFDGNQLIVAPTPTDSWTYTLTYFKRFPALSASQATNWLLMNAPNVYLYGSLIESSPYLNNDTRMLTWYRMYSAAVQAVIDQDNRLRFGGGALVMRA